MKPTLITNFPSIFGTGLSKSLLRDSDSFLSDLFPNRAWPPANVKQGEKSYTVELSAPGYDKSDIEVAVENNVLTVTFEKKEAKNDYLSKEFSYNYSKRSFELPEHCEVEEIKTSMENGILSISIPHKVREPDTSKRKLIPIE